MMRVFLLFYCMLVLAPGVSGQLSPGDGVRYADSLEAILKKPATDSTKARVYFLLSDYWSGTDTTKAQYYLETARRQSGKNSFLQALYYFYRGQLIYSSDFAISETSYEKADVLLQKFTTKEAFLFRAKVWNSWGALRQLQDDNQAFLDALLTKSIPFAQRSADTVYLARVYTNVGLIFMNQVEYGKASAYFDLAVLLLNHKGAVSSNELLYAYILAAKNDFFRDSFSRGKLFLDRAKVILKSHPNSDYSIEYYGSESYYFKETKQYAAALNSLDSGIAYTSRFNNIYERESLLFSKYQVYDALKRYPSARNILIEIIRNPVRNAIQNRATHYRAAANTYFHMGVLDSAYRFLDMYAHIRDSLYVDGIVNHLNELEQKFSNSEKEKQILQLQSEKDKAALIANKHQQTNILLIVICIFLLAAGLFFFSYSKCFVNF